MSVAPFSCVCVCRCRGAYLEENLKRLYEENEHAAMLDLLKSEEMKGVRFSASISYAIIMGDHLTLLEEFIKPEYNMYFSRNLISDLLIRTHCIYTKLPVKGDFKDIKGQWKKRKALNEVHGRIRLQLLNDKRTPKKYILDAITRASYYGDSYTIQEMLDYVGRIPVRLLENWANRGRHNGWTGLYYVVQKKREKMGLPLNDNYGEVCAKTGQIKWDKILSKEEQEEFNKRRRKSNKRLKRSC